MREPYPIRSIAEGVHEDLLPGNAGHWHLRAGDDSTAEHRPGALARLSAAMSWDPSPWCPVAF
jgi:hypothetical protein